MESVITHLSILKLIVVPNFPLVLAKEDLPKLLRTAASRLIFISTNSFEVHMVEMMKYVYWNEMSVV